MKFTSKIIMLMAFFCSATVFALEFEAIKNPKKTRIITVGEVAIFDSTEKMDRDVEMFVIPDLKDGIAIIAKTFKNGETNKILITHHRPGNDISSIKRYFQLLTPSNEYDELEIYLYYRETETSRLTKEIGVIGPYLAIELAGKTDLKIITEISYELPENFSSLENGKDRFTTLGVKKNGEIINTSLLEAMDAKIFDSENDWKENNQILINNMKMLNFRRAKREYNPNFDESTFFRWEGESFFSALSLPQRRRLKEISPVRPPRHFWQYHCELSTFIFVDELKAKVLADLKEQERKIWEEKQWQKRFSVRRWSMQSFKQLRTKKQPLNQTSAKSHLGLFKRLFRAIIKKNFASQSKNSH